MKYPTNWKQKTLSEISRIETGTTPSKKNKKYYGGHFPFVKPPKLQNGKINHADEHLTDDGINVARTLPKNSILVSCIGDIGRLGILEMDAAFNQQINGVLFNSEVIPKYGFYFLQNPLVQSFLKANSSATTVSIINKTKFSKTSVAYPNVDEQQKIVDKIEELFSVIDATNNEIQEARSKLKSYEYSFLQKCIYGEYLDVLGVNKSKDVNIENLRPLPKGWIWKKLPELGELGRGKSKHRPRNDKSLFGGKYPFIQTGEVRNSYKYIKNFTTTYNEIGLAQSKLWKKGTLCITIAANIADTAILDFDACFPDSVVGFVANEQICNIEYVEFFIRTEKERLSAYAPATAQKNINLHTLNNLVIPLPPLDTQQQIVDMAELHSSVTHKLDNEISTLLDKKNSFKQSILKQAFGGKLV